MSQMFRSARVVLASCFLTAVLLASLSSTGCSLDVPPHGGGSNISIDLHDTGKSSSLAGAFESLSSGTIRILAAGPTSLSDFGCFAANIAGSGIPADSGGQIQGCQVASNITVGFIPNPVAAGTSINAVVPGGPARTIYAFGIYPSNNCPQSHGGSTGGSGSSGGGGYLLGQVTQDIFADTSITVPVTVTAGATPAVTCSNNNGGGSGCTGLAFPSPFLPQGGTTAGGTVLVINAIGTYGGSTVTVGGNSAGALASIDGTHFSVTTPAGTAGAATVTVNDNCGNAANIGTFTYTGGDYLAIADNGQGEGDGSSFNFGTVSSPPVTNNFSVTNTGAAVATSISISANPVTPFSITSNTCGTTLSSGSVCTIQVQFYPTSPGSYNSSFTISSSDVSATRALSGSM